MRGMLGLRMRSLLRHVRVETLGGWGEEAALTVKNMGRLQGLRLGIPPAQATQHLFQRLAINLWRGNATLWIRRLPTRSLEVDGLIFSVHSLYSFLYFRFVFLLMGTSCVNPLLGVLDVYAQHGKSGKSA